MGGGVDRRRLVKHLGVRLEGDEPVREADRNEKLPPVVRRKLHGDMLAECRRRSPDIDGDVENAPSRHANELVLREGRNLKMKAAKRADSCGERMVVLDEIEAQSSPLPGRLVVD